MYEDLNLCPRCGSKNIKAYAFSLDTTAGVRCEDCDFYIEEEVSWEDCDPDPNVPEEHPDFRGNIIRAHDRKAYPIVRDIWNSVNKDNLSEFEKRLPPFD